jgi:penicillin-binding protein 1A
MPQGMSQVWIDPQTGVKATAGGAAIAEAFKPGTGPNLVTSVIGVNSNAFNGLDDGSGDGFGAPDDAPQPPQNIDNGGGDGANDSGRGFLFGRGGLF